MPQPTRVFFSYPHANRAFATRLAKSLAEQGLELDTVDPSAPAVRNGIDRLEKQVLSADAVVLLINPRSKFDESQLRIWQAILGAAWANPKLRILPVLLRDADLPPFVRSATPRKDVQAIRIQDLSDLHSATQAILDSLKRSSPVYFTRSRSGRSFRSYDLNFEPIGGSRSIGKLPGSASAGEEGESPSSVLFEIYPSSTEEDRNERHKRLAEIREYVEQLKR